MSTALLAEAFWPSSSLETGRQRELDVVSPTTRKGIIATLGIGLLFWGCTNQGVTDIPADAVRIPDGQVDTLAHEHYSGIVDRGRDVLRSHEEWACYWKRMYSNVSPMPELPAVDFDESMVIAAAMGARPSGGFAIDVVGVHHEASVLYVEVQETEPGESCVVTDAFTQPVIAVRVERQDGPVTFIERETVRECS